MKEYLLSRLSTNALSWVLVIILSAMWGTSYILIKRSLLVFNPFELASLRTTIATICFLPVVLRNYQQIARSDWKYLFWIGLLAILFPAMLFPLAQTHLASALTGILNSLTGLSTLLIGALFFRQKITGYRLLGILLGIIGTAMLILSGTSQQITSNAFYGIFVVLATICNALNSNIVKKYLPHMRPLVMSAMGLATIGPIAFLYLCTTEVPQKIMHHEAGLRSLGYVTILAVVSTSLGFILYNKLLQISTPLFASVTAYLIPVVALLWGLSDNESITWMHYLGMVTILSGISLINRNR